MEDKVFRSVIKDIDQVLTYIAKNILYIETLETRKFNRLDFHDISVWQLEEALEYAYQSGRR